VGVEERLEGVLVLTERLRVPLDPDHESTVRVLEAFHHAVLGTLRAGDETVAEPIDRLMVEAVHGKAFLAEEIPKAGPRSRLDPVDPSVARFGAVVTLAPREGRREVLDQCSTGGNV
jgi:hypothetical protein